ncbi:hypothetical protein ACFSQJ_18355 [Croceitalea marina]|uniref:Lipoprotein n=1 Tax=Croceitalea marina TaxID=1775166 RepID=A0ABW5N472_9FLAO
MKRTNLFLIALLAIIMISCTGNKKDTQNKTSTKVETEISTSFKTDLDAEKITKKLCQEFPESLIMQHNPSFLRIENEPIELIPGQLSYCKIKLFYGKKEYEFYEGQVGATAPKTKDPLWQYNPERSPSIYFKVDGFGEKAVFIGTTNQLLILKEGILYNIAPPSRGKTTDTGKENKEIAIEMAKHYKI